MKKLLKILLVLAGIFIVLVVAALVTLKVMFPPEKVKLMAQNYVKDNFHREITFDGISFNVIGVTINNFALSESTTFKNGTFIKADKLVVKIDLKPLFDKHIKIKTVGLEDVVVNIIKNKNGKFNFDDLMSLGSSAQTKPEAQKDNTATPYTLVADNIYIKNSTINFTDKMADMKFSVRQVNVNISDFDFTDVFKYSASFITDIKMPALNLSPVKLSINGTSTLAGFDMAKAGLDISAFKVNYKTAEMSMSGSVNNFDKPAVKLKGYLKGIDSKLAAEFAGPDVPTFALPQINITADAGADITKGTAKVNNIKVSIGSSYIITNADVDYSQPNLKYNSLTKISISLKEISDVAKDMLSAFKLTGTISGQVTAASGITMPNVKGNIDFNGIGAVAAGKEIKDITGRLTIDSITSLKTNIIKGTFAGSPFKTSVSYSKPAKTMDINFFFDMDKFTLDDINFDSFFSSKSAQPVAVAQPAAKEAQPVVVAPRSDPMNIKADIYIHRIANNIFSTDELVIKADIKNFDNKLDRANGVLSFSSKNGEIRDIDKLMSSSVVLKLIFTSVRIVQKAFNVVKLDKMSLGSDKITYSLIEGQYSLDNGLITINKSEIDSDLTTVKASGNVNLLTEKLNMKIESHIGKVTDSGFKPVVINVGGTLNDPSFKLDVVSTVTSVFNIPGNILKGGAKGTANVVTGVASGTGKVVSGVANGTGKAVKGVAGGTADIVKGVAGGIGSLFKKKKPENEGGK